APERRGEEKPQAGDEQSLPELERPVGEEHRRPECPLGHEGNGLHRGEGEKRNDRGDRCPCSLPEQPPCGGGRLPQGRPGHRAASVRGVVGPGDAGGGDTPLVGLPSTGRPAWSSPPRVLTVMRTSSWSTLLRFTLPRTARRSS